MRLRAGRGRCLRPAADCAPRARSATQLRAFLAFCENAADGPRILPFQGAGEPPPSETLPAFLRSAFSNTTGASALARCVEPDRRRQAFAGELDRGDRGQRGLAVLGRDGGDRLADIAHDRGRRRAARSPQLTPGNRARRREIEFADARMRDVRAQDHAFELAVMADIDGVFRRSRHLVARLDARRDDIVAVEAAGAGFGHRAKDVRHRRRSGRDGPTAPRRFPRATASPCPWPRASGRETRRPRR